MRVSRVPSFFAVVLVTVNLSAENFTPKFVAKLLHVDANDRSGNTVDVGMLGGGGDDDVIGTKAWWIVGIAGVEMRNILFCSRVTKTYICS